MKTELKIILKTEDCMKIIEDLKKLKVCLVDGLNPETYLLYNKIKGMCCGYCDIEDKDE